MIGQCAPLGSEFRLGRGVRSQPAQVGLFPILMWRPDRHVRLAAVVACGAGAHRTDCISSGIVRRLWINTTVPGLQNRTAGRAARSAPPWTDPMTAGVLRGLPPLL